MMTRQSGALLFASGFALATLIFGPGHVSGKRIACDPSRLHGMITEDQAEARCGSPWTRNMHVEGVDEISEWVYDANTFVWFRNGVMQSYKAQK